VFWGARLNPALRRLKRVVITIKRNPAGMEAVYIECLNACFDGWGGPGMYRWCFARTGGSHPADLMVLEEDGHLIAGSVINYRHVSLANNAAILVAVMTGSWTLPAARQNGCFKRIIQGSLALAEERGAALLLAFVTESNPSSRGWRLPGPPCSRRTTCFHAQTLPRRGPRHQRLSSKTHSQPQRSSKTVCLWTGPGNPASHIPRRSGTPSFWSVHMIPSCYPSSVRA
jgi:hypothetical protein